MKMEFIKAVGKDLYVGEKQILLRGFGLGGWFLPEGYMWKLYTKCDRPRRMEKMIETLCGREYADNFWRSYLDGYITEQDIELIAEEGFNSVRLPLNARHLYHSEKQVLTMNMDSLSRIDTLIEWCRKYQIYVILDMHGAPGGQTGQNIDDSEEDLPALFMEKRYEEELVYLWTEFAKRYKDEPVIAGYDLLNEPLPNFFSQYNDMLLPLYRRLIEEIRRIDTKHMIILEGLHWSTDFSVFDSFTREEAGDNIMLQFHKYWSNPDIESMEVFLQTANRLNVPLFMGEGGENNCDWYTTLFPLLEQHNISWSFWSYKKMECTNSPITFASPEGWPELLHWIDGKSELSKERAIHIFNSFLHSITNFKVNQKVLNALKRQKPLRIPAEAYHDYQIQSKRVIGATLRETDPVSIIFANGKTGVVDYRRYGGEEQKEEDNLLVQLVEGDRVGYLFSWDFDEVELIVSGEGEGILSTMIDTTNKRFKVNGKGNYSSVIKNTVKGQQTIWLGCEKGTILIDYIELS